MKKSCFAAVFAAILLGAAGCSNEPDLGELWNQQQQQKEQLRTAAAASQPQSGGVLPRQ